MKIYPTIAEALTRGTSKLAVDGVVVVGEHGDYPKNEKGQTKYPRWEFFQQIVKVYRTAAVRFRCSTTSIFRGTGTGRRRCTTPRGRWAFAYHGGIEPAGDMADSVGRNAARIAHSGSDVHLLWRRGQLRFPRSGDHPVHGGAAARRRRRA